MSNQDHAYALPSGFMLEEYQIERVLGSGGFGITYYAWDRHLDKAVAIPEANLNHRGATPARHFGLGWRGTFATTNPARP